MLMLQKPETASGFVPSAEMLPPQHRDSSAVVAEDTNPVAQTRSDLLTMQLLASSPESAVGVSHLAEYLDPEMKQRMTSSQLEGSLPKTVSEALRDPRPMVITSATSPFEVVDVNEAWVGLCGFSREEAKQKRNLGEMLSGPETDLTAAREMVAALRREHYGRATLINYTKAGRKFENRVQVGTMVSSSSPDGERRIEYFVGLLEETPQSRATI